MYDLQKASIWKRISAALFDVILLVIVVIGMATALSAILGYSHLSNQLESSYATYEQCYGIKLDMTQEEYKALDEETRARYDAAHKAFSEDEGLLQLYSKLINYTMIIVTFSILIAYLLLEFVVPLLLKNGQTLGKKIFSIGLMREDCVKITPLMLFVRTVLGKYTVETMIPVMILVMIFFGIMGAFGIVLLGILLTIQLAILIANRSRPLLHDKMARTVCIDIASQMIFENEEELLAYQKRVQAERAERAAY